VSQVIVIGSGIGSLASALRLKAKGHSVKVFEASDKVGGKLGVYRSNGYRWDTGPSLFTMPHFVDELFELFDENPKEFFNYQKQDIVCNYFWEDGTQFSSSANVDNFCTEAAKTFNEPREQIRSYLRKSAVKYDLTASLFLEKSLHKLRTYASSKAAKSVLQVGKLDISATLNEVNETSFTNPKLIQFFNRFATYNGSSPYKTPGIMSMIPTLEMQFGTFYPRGGMRNIVESLQQLGERNGVEFQFNEKAKSIDYTNKIITGVTTEKGSYNSDFVVSGIDAFYTYTSLLPKLKAPTKTLEQEKSSSAIIFYWGIKKTFPELDLHNIFFSENYKKEFDAIFDKKTLAQDSTIYLNISSKVDKKDAPEGCENWFVMVNVPTNNGQDWDQIVLEAKKQVIEKLNRNLKVDLGELIETEEILDPVKIELKTSSHQGSLYGSASNSKFSAFLRHPNFSNQIKGLYFCGGSVHPGGGIPLCIKSGQIVADLIPDA
jgi:phytoene desaturase